MYQKIANYGNQYIRSFISTFIIIFSLSTGVVVLQLRTSQSPSISLEPAQQRLATINTSRVWHHLGFKNLIAGTLWLDFVQFYGLNIIRKPGESGLRRRYHEISYEYLDTITRLDPRFIQPYINAFNAVGLKQGRPDLARLILIRGLMNLSQLRNEERVFTPIIWLNTSLIYLLLYPQPDSVRFTYEYAANWVDALSRPEQLRLNMDSSQLRMLGTSLADRVERDPTYAAFLGWQQVFLGADDPEIKEIGRQELEKLGATFSQQEDGRVIPNPPPPEAGLSRMNLSF